MTTHGKVYAVGGDCVSITFGMSLKSPPHTPVMRGILKSVTTMCDHDIGVVVDG